MNPPEIEIVEYSDEFKEDIKRLNYEWLQKYFRVEERDKIILSNPKELIIDEGGYVFFAKKEGKILGTISLLKANDGAYELSKMAVSEKSRGLGIGKILMEHCLDFAKKKNIKKLFLYSNKGLKPAIHLYRKYGFVEVELDEGLYERADIKMEKELA